MSRESLRWLSAIILVVRMAMFGFTSHTSKPLSTENAVIAMARRSSQNPNKTKTMPPKYETFRGFLTSHALTDGIVECDLRFLGNGMVEAGYKMYSIYAHVEGRDWHRTLDGAIKRAEVMKSKKILSLKKSLEKMESMEFKIIQK